MAIQRNMIIHQPVNKYIDNPDYNTGTDPVPYKVKHVYDAPAIVKADTEMLVLLDKAEKEGFPKGSLFRSIHWPDNKYLINPDYNTALD
jgi:hypothetical protein